MRSRLLTLCSMPRSAGCRVGCNAASSRRPRGGHHRAGHQHAQHDDRRDDRGSTSPRSHVTLPPDVPPAGPAAPGGRLPGGGRPQTCPGGGDGPREPEGSPGGRRLHAHEGTVAPACARRRAAGRGACGGGRPSGHVRAVRLLVDPDLAVTAGDTVTFSGTFANHPLVWTGGDFATRATGRRSSSPSHARAPTPTTACCTATAAACAGRSACPGDQHPARVAFAASPAAPQPGEPVTFTYTGDPDPDGTLSGGSGISMATARWRRPRPRPPRPTPTRARAPSPCGCRRSTTATRDRPWPSRC